MGYGTRDKGRNDPRNGDETNDNLSLKTLRAKSYGLRLVFSRLYSREFFARFASRDRDTRTIQTPPYLLSTRNDEKYVSSKEDGVDESSRKIINGTRIGRWVWPSVVKAKF